MLGSISSVSIDLCYVAIVNFGGIEINLVLSKQRLSVLGAGNNIKRGHILYHQSEKANAMGAMALSKVIEYICFLIFRF